MLYLHLKEMVVFLKLLQFYFKPKRDEISQALRRGGFGGEKFSFSKDVAEGYVEGIQDFIKKPDSRFPIFWYIQFRKEVPIYSDKALAAINFFNGELVKVLLDNSGIIKISPSDCGKINRKFKRNKKDRRMNSEFPNYVLSILAGKIVRWEDEKKISPLLLQQFDKESLKGETKAYLSTFRLKNKEEENKLTEELKEYLTRKKKTHFYHNEFLNTFTSHFEKEELINLAKKGFVAFIDPVLTAQYSELESQQPIAKSPEVVDVDEQTLGHICVIDSGVTSKKMEKYLRKETLVDTKEDKDLGSGHGTLVSSIAMFGKDILDETSILKPRSNIISYNVWGENGVESPLHDILSEVYSLENKNTNVFNLSINYPSPPKTKEHLAVHLRQAELIDSFVNQNNILLINSAGNIISKEILKRVQKDFPYGLCNFSVASPAFAPSVFSVGAYSAKTNTISDFGLIDVPFHKKQVQFEDGNPNFRAPHVFAIGGDSTREEGAMVTCLSKKDTFCSDIGTSFAAPLVALACRQVMDLYYPSFCKNSETVKAIILNSSKKKVFKDKTLFFLEDPASVGFCNGALSFNYEGKIRTRYKNEKINKNIVEKDRGYFYVPKNASGIEFVLVYTSNYHLRKMSIDYGEPNLKIYGISKGSENARQIYSTTIGSINGPTIFGKVKFERNYHGKWYWDLFFNPKNIPLYYRSSVIIRYGLSLKVLMGDESFKEVSQAYAEAKTELNWKEIKEPVEESLKEKIHSQLQHFK